MGNSGGAAASVAFFFGVTIGLWNLGVDRPGERVRSRSVRAARL